MLFSKHKPDWLHACLPATCVVCGVAAVWSLHDTLGLASGALLIAAALSILLLRRFERRAQTRALITQHSSFAPAPSRLAATAGLVRDIMPPMLGHHDIDRQHRSLAAKAATLRVAFFHGDASEDIELLVHELIDSLSNHVQFEIDAMGRLGVARRDEDVDADRLQVANAEYDFHLYCTGGMTLEELIDRVAGPLVAGHLARRHPALPGMQTALRRLRGVKA